MNQAIYIGVFGQVVGSTSTDLLLAPGSAGLFSAGIVMKTVYQGIHTNVDLNHKAGSNSKQATPFIILKSTLSRECTRNMQEILNLN